MTGMIDRRYRQKILTCIKIITIFLVMTAVIAPFYVSVIYALKDSSDISVHRLAWPQHPTINNFVKVITENEQFITGYKNSILTTIPAVLILMTATSMAAYVLARFNGRFYRSVYMIFVSGILIPIQCIMLPLYLNFFRLGLTNSNLGFVIARTGLQIDGCNRFTMFWKIVFPLMKPVNATQLVLNTLFIWNDYTTAVILLRKVESRTLLLAQMAYFNEYTSELNLAFAFFILAMLPILILYFCMQKYVVSGIMMGAVKG